MVTIHLVKMFLVKMIHKILVITVSKRILIYCMDFSITWSEGENSIYLNLNQMLQMRGNTQISRYV